MPLLRPRRLVLALTTATVVVVAAGAWALQRGEDDPLDAVRDLDGVARVESGGVVDDVVLEPRATATQVAAVVRALPQGGELRIGSARLVVSRNGRGAERSAPALAEAAELRVPVRIHVRYDGERRLEAQAAGAARVAPLAREIVDRFGPEQGVDTVSVAADDLPSAAPVSLDLREPSRALLPGALGAVADLADRDVRVFVLRGQGEVRVAAESRADVAAAWRDADAALSSVRAEDREDVDVYVDVVREEDAQRRAWPVLSGHPGSSPDRALALLRRLESGGARGFVTTDLAYARARLQRRAGGVAAAEAARAAGAKRVEVEWPSGADWLAPVPGALRDAAAVDDAPAAAVRVIRGAARARAAGIPAVRWIRPTTGDALPRLTLARPAWISDATPLLEQRAALRRLTRAARAIDWPGRADVTLMLGPNACGPDDDRYSAVTVTVTARGRAVAAEGGARCDVAGSLTAVRRAWNASAR